MKLPALLHYEMFTPEISQSATPVILIHGLFGDLHNLGVLGRGLRTTHTVVQIDVRNHGDSPRANTMSYAEMAQDVLDLITALTFEKVIVIGHSMGGKIAMALAALAPETVKALVVIDIAPVAYGVRRHDEIIAALEDVTNAGVTTRQAATSVMEQRIREDGVIPFLLKSFAQGEWKFNLPVIKAQYESIIGWEPLPAQNVPLLLIPGGKSSYVKPEYREAIMQQFPQATAHVIAGCGHWVHAEKPDAVLRAIGRFLEKI
ncbi:alpha/beta fold hydrolase [Morganella psychrotolerans]|uniref:alpha/beta fold hydrolase n=1 Tax=Morganella psychrotolerans TaxID=368603 RepID=UPI0039AFEA9C